MSLLITSSKLSPVLHSLDRTNNVCRSLDLVADVWLWVVAKLHLWHLTLCVLGFQRIMLELCLYNSLFIKQFVYITVCLHNSFDQMCKDFDDSNCCFFFFYFHYCFSCRSWHAFVFQSCSLLLKCSFISVRYQISSFGQFA